MEIIFRWVGLGNPGSTIMFANVTLKVTDQVEICFWNDMQHWWSNRHVAQIPQCTRSISHNEPICNRNIYLRALLLQNGALWDIFLLNCGICEIGLLTDEEGHPRHDEVIKWKHFRVTGLCAGKSPVTGEFPAQRPATRSFDDFFDLRLNIRLS